MSKVLDSFASSILYSRSNIEYKIFSDFRCMFLGFNKVIFSSSRNSPINSSGEFMSITVNSLGAKLSVVKKFISGNSPSLMHL